MSALQSSSGAKSIKEKTTNYRSLPQRQGAPKIHLDHCEICAKFKMKNNKI